MGGGLSKSLHGFWICRSTVDASIGVVDMARDAINVNCVFL